MLPTFALMITGPPWYWAPAAPAKANRLMDSNAADTIFLRKVLSSTGKRPSRPIGAGARSALQKGVRGEGQGGTAPPADAASVADQVHGPGEVPRGRDAV